MYYLAPIAVLLFTLGFLLALTTTEVAGWATVGVLVYLATREF